MFFGDAVYEVIRIYNSLPWLMSEHIERLATSLRKIQIVANIPSILQHALTNIGDNGIDDGYIYIQVSRGTAARDHLFPEHTQANVLIYSKPFKVDPWATYRDDGIATITHEDIRWLGRDIKSVNLLPNCLAKQAAHNAGAQEAILIQADDIVTEASANNVFIAKKDILRTTPADRRILGGITRAYIIQQAKALGIKVLEEHFSREDLFNADEVFVTGTTAEILHVSTIDNHKVG